MSAWTDRLSPASFRGVAFSVKSSRGVFGRRNAPHEYPFRDTPWVEDIGRRMRIIRMVGFIVGADALARRDAIVEASERGQSGLLVHPTLKELTVNLEVVEVEESWDQGRVFGLQFTFIESGSKVFPSAVTSTVKAGQLSALQSFVVTAQSYFVAVRAAYNKGAAVVKKVQDTAALFVREVESIKDDATNIFNFISNLPGSVTGLHGRYFGGNTRSGLIQVPANSSTQTVDSLLAMGSVLRSNVIAADTSLMTTSGATDTDDIAASMQTLTSALLAQAIDPQDALRILGQLTGFVAPIDPTTAPIGSAINTAVQGFSDAIRRSIAISIANASLLYQPSSYDDAFATRQTVCDYLDVEIEVAGDQGEDDMFTSLRALRAVVSFDMETRGASLAPIATFNSNTSFPAPNWALRLYRDLTRTDGLIIQVNPVHPLFMPTTFKALSS